MSSTKTKAALPGRKNAASNEQRTECTKTTKTRTTLSYLLRGPRHRFQAERWGGHALHSTVSTLEHEYGIEFDREWTDVPNRFGTRTRVKLYSVRECCRSAAQGFISGSCKPKKKPEGA